MSEDFYCENVLSGKIAVETVFETSDVLAYRHTRPFWETHIVVIPKRHISSLITMDAADNATLIALFDVIRRVAANVVAERGSARVLTNLGKYQESKHLHFHVYAGERLKSDNPI
jgi:histidine triad (HIT) family protein